MLTSGDIKHDKWFYTLLDPGIFNWGWVGNVGWGEARCHLFRHATVTIKHLLHNTRVNANTLDVESSRS